MVGATKAGALKSTDLGASAKGPGIDGSQQAARFVATVESSSSQQGARLARFDYVVSDDRKYPRGYFGVDELFLHAMDWANRARRKVYRIPEANKPGFAIHLETYGTIAYRATILWDGQDLTLRHNEHIGDPVLRCRAECDASVDLARGRLTCALVGGHGFGKSEGDRFLMWAIGLRKPRPTQEDKDAALEKAEKEFDRIKAMRTASTDVIDYFCRFIEHQCKPYAPTIDEPLFVRATFAVSPAVEVLIHVENGKLNVLRGKPGETLLQGAAELHIPEKAMKPFFEGETTLLFLCRAGYITATGDLNVLSKMGLLPKEGVQMLQQMAKTQKLIGPDNPFYIPMITKVPPDQLGLEFEGW